MAAVTVTAKKFFNLGNTQRRVYTVTIAATGDTLATGFKKIDFVTVTNPTASQYSAEAVLVGGTLSPADTNITTASDVMVTRKVDGGTTGHYKAVPGSGSVAITSSSGTDTSTVMYEVINPQVVHWTISGGTITFITTGGVAVTGAVVEFTGY